MKIYRSTRSTTVVKYSSSSTSVVPSSGVLDSTTRVGNSTILQVQLSSTGGLYIVVLVPELSQHHFCLMYTVVNQKHFALVVPGLLYRRL
jgi:hypothetical protein